MSRQQHYCNKKGKRCKVKGNLNMLPISSIWKMFSGLLIIYSQWATTPLQTLLAAIRWQPRQPLMQQSRMLLVGQKQRRRHKPNMHCKRRVGRDRERRLLTLTTRERNIHNGLILMQQPGSTKHRQTHNRILKMLRTIPITKTISRFMRRQRRENHTRYHKLSNKRQRRRRVQTRRMPNI